MGCPDRDRSLGTRPVMADILRELAEHGEFGPPVAALATFCASLFVLGLVVPATALLVALGGLAGLGVVDLAPTLLGSVLGSAAGGALSFRLGHSLGVGFVRRRLASGLRRNVARTRLLVRRHGVGLLIASRFLGPLRSVAPFVAGMTGMRTGAFHVANLASALLWPAALLLPAWLAARGWPLPDLPLP